MTVDLEDQLTKIKTVSLEVPGKKNIADIDFASGFPWMSDLLKLIPDLEENLKELLTEWDTDLFVDDYDYYKTLQIQPVITRLENGEANFEDKKLFVEYTIVNVIENIRNMGGQIQPGDLEEVKKAQLIVSKAMSDSTPDTSEDALTEKAMELLAQRPDVFLWLQEMVLFNETTLPIPNSGSENLVQVGAKPPQTRKF